MARRRRRHPEPPRPQARSVSPDEMRRGYYGGVYGVSYGISGGCLSADQFGYTTAQAADGAGDASSGGGDAGAGGGTA